MKIVVTGALGHIGSYLIRYLPTVFSNCEIIMLDNLLTQRYPSLFNLPKTGNYQFLETDVTSADITPMLNGANVVVHLAAITNATASFDNKEEVESVNFVATEKVANACLLAGVPMILASSTSVYGTQEEQVDENCGPEELKPQSPYAETKLREEALISDLVNNNGMKAIIFRYGTIFGDSPGMRFHTAVNKFCWQAVMKQPLTVWETAYDQKRPYLALSDCARAIAFVIENNLFDGQVYNVVTENLTVRQVIDEIRQHVSNLDVNFVESKIMNQLSYEVLNTKMTQAGFKIEGNLKAGISNTIELLNRSNSLCR